MKLALHFDDSVAINVLRQAILAAGENTTIHYSAAHEMDASSLLSVLSAAGSEKNLVLGFEGARLDSRSLQQAVSFAGGLTSVNINSAQAVTPSVLVTAITAAGDGKSLRAVFSGSGATEELLCSALEAAGRQVDIGIGASQSLSMDTLLATLEAAGDERNLAVEMGGAQPVANLAQALEAAGASTGIAINTAHCLSQHDLSSLMLGAGDGKHLSLSFNGSQIEGTNLPQVVAAAGTNTLVRLNTAEALSAARLLATIEATGHTRRLSVEFNGVRTTAAGLVQAIQVSGISTSIGVSSAQSIKVTDLATALEAAGKTKKLDLQLNGGHVAANDLKQLVETAGDRCSLSVTGAQALQLPALLEMLKAAA
ncbi:hypothetical protein [Pseudomonas sp. TCU-HL1]|uniref:hypothetical protein n=1 Tax=Pseudomonas sp. TCU-HL1 TaxID=1856685 RepID=UPI00083CE400|nr:hypothetical protein [Pseudomonas sp. TCU-HL1]AOE83953.1 hypothetical protein THL1_1405 [Pseudomonas sp. TCU-HL1]